MAAKRKASHGRAETRSDFDDVLERIAVDPAFEDRVLSDPERALASFRLDENQLAVLRQYRVWRLIR